MQRTFENVCLEGVDYRRHGFGVDVGVSYELHVLGALLRKVDTFHKFSNVSATVHLPLTRRYVENF